MLHLDFDEPLDRSIKFSEAASSISPELKSELRLTFKPDFDKWAGPFSVSEYQTAISLVVEEIVGVIFEANDNLTNGFNVLIVDPKSEPFGEEISRSVEQMRSASKIAAAQALKSVQKNSLVTWFYFPAPVKAACEQYLVYFIQFLEDLGIKANTEIKQYAGRVLFSVTPEEGSRALKKIREALEVYLNLPRNPEFNTVGEQFTDLAAVQLRSQVFFLQSQPELANATIQAKDAAIQALNFTVFQQKQLLIDDQKHESPSDKNEEPILLDTIHLTEYEGKGFRIDLPTIRRLKRSFGVGQYKSVKKPHCPEAVIRNQNEYPVN